MNTKLNSKTLDLLEARFVQGLLGEAEDVSGTVLEILRRVMHDNGRLVVGVTPGDPGDILANLDKDEDGEDYPFPRLVNED